jgi:DnaJ-class molecular chaperone
MDISKWCAKQDCRVYLNTPFNFEGRTFAGNGHAMLSVQEEAGHPDIDESLKKVMTSFLDTDSLLFIPLPANLNLPEATRCEKCRGTAKITVTQCKECVGEGVISFENDHNSYECNCKTCDGAGDETAIGVGSDCYECIGYGTSYERFSTIDIHGVTIETRYARLLSSIPNLEISGDDNKLYFRSLDVRGAVLGHMK